MHALPCIQDFCDKWVENVAPCSAFCLVTMGETRQGDGEKGLDRRTSLRGRVSSSGPPRGRAVWVAELRRAAAQELPPCFPARGQPSVLTLDSMFLKVPLFLGLIVLGTHVWTIQKEFVNIYKKHDYFVASVEFAVARFNDDNMEMNAYRLLEVRRAQQKVSGSQSAHARIPVPTEQP